MLKQYSFSKYKFSLVFISILVGLIGVLVITSANASLQKRQLMGIAIGVCVMIIISLIDYHWIAKFSIPFYVLNIALLLLVIRMGVNANNAVRWINIGGIQFQPSEFSKVFLIIFFAKLFSDHQERLNKPWFIGLNMILIGIPLFLILKQPNLSTTIITAVIFAILYYVAGLHYGIILVTLGSAIPAALGFIWWLRKQSVDFIRLPQNYQLKRIMAWLEPEKYTDIAYQQLNSIQAIGSGQLIGKGLNNNVVASSKNGNFISFAETDFIFAVVGEELGFIGSMLIILLLTLLCFQIIRVASKAKDKLGQLICIGVAVYIGFQTFVNIGVTTGMLPNTGIPLPFISYGLTSLVSLFGGLGLVLNVHLQSNQH